MALGVSKSSARVAITVDLVSASLKEYKKHRKTVYRRSRNISKCLTAAGTSISPVLTASANYS